MVYNTHCMLPMPAVNPYVVSPLGHTEGAVWEKMKAAVLARRVAQAHQAQRLLQREVLQRVRRQPLPGARLGLRC